MKIMKKIKYFLLVSMSLFLMSSCKKGTDLRMPDMHPVNSAVLQMDQSNSSPFINVSNVDAYTLTVKVDLLWKTPTVQKVDLMVAMARDYSKQYVLETITTFPTTVTVTGADIKKAIPALASDPIVAGDQFYVFGNVTMNDGTYLPGLLDDGTLAVSAANVNVESILKDAVPAISIAVPCAYSQAFAVGSYHAYSDDWGVDGDVTITADPEDSHTVYISGLEAIDGLNEDKGPLPVTINADYSVTVPHTVLASSTLGWGPSYDYHNIAYAGGGTYNTCDGSFTLTCAISVDEGTFGTYHWTLTRN